MGKQQANSAENREDGIEAGPSQENVKRKSKEKSENSKGKDDVPDVGHEIALREDCGGRKTPNQPGPSKNKDKKESKTKKSKSRDGKSRSIVIINGKRVEPADSDSQSVDSETEAAVIENMKVRNKQMKKDMKHQKKQMDKNMKSMKKKMAKDMKQMKRKMVEDLENSLQLKRRKHKYQSSSSSSSSESSKSSSSKSEDSDSNSEIEDNYNNHVRIDGNQDSIIVINGKRYIPEDN